MNTNNTKQTGQSFLDFIMALREQAQVHRMIEVEQQIVALDIEAIVLREAVATLDEASQGDPIATGLLTMLYRKEMDK